MINCLYPQFRKWSEKGSVWITSDPHFLDEDMNWRYKFIEYLYPYSSNPSEEIKAERIAEYIISTWNKYVGKNDTLIICGDIGCASWVGYSKAGYRVLEAGNHDGGVEKYLKKDFYTGFRQFDEVYSGPLFIGEKILISHGEHRGPWANFHGHYHSSNLDAPIVRYYDMYSFGELQKGVLINCTVERNMFVPINLGQFIKDGGMKDICSSRESLTTNAVERKSKKEESVNECQEVTERTTFSKIMEKVKRKIRTLLTGK